jgi:hypothetical protein
MSERVEQVNNILVLDAGQIFSPSLAFERSFFQRDNPKLLSLLMSDDYRSSLVIIEPATILFGWRSILAERACSLFGSWLLVI